MGMYPSHLDSGSHTHTEQTCLEVGTTSTTTTSTSVLLNGESCRFGARRRFHDLQGWSEDEAVYCFPDYGDDERRHDVEQKAKGKPAEGRQAYQLHSWYRH
jgi:hypothetical protein